MNALLGQKIKMSARFDERGKKIPVTLIKAGPCPVVQIKTDGTDGYFAVQIGLGTRKPKRTSRPILGHVKKAGLDSAPQFLGEVRLAEASDRQAGKVITVDQVFAPGDRVAVTGISKGRGFAGVVKRWGFKGGPATHGQSDRHRAPGSIGTQGPGRVVLGKKLPGRMGGKRVTVTGLTVVDLDPEANWLWLKGAVPGPRKGLVMVKKIGEVKNFTPLLKKEEKGKEEKSRGEKDQDQDQGQGGDRGKSKGGTRSKGKGGGGEDGEEKTAGQGSGEASPAEKEN